MAFVHHPRQRQPRLHHDTETQAQQRPSFRTSNDQVPDWSIVFPGRTRATLPGPLDLQLASPPSSDPVYLASSQSHVSTDPSYDNLAATELTLPPFHDGTGRFTTSNDPSPTSEAGILESPSFSRSDVCTECSFGVTDSQDDADEEAGFGSGSGSDFESIVAASMPSCASNRLGFPKVRRGSRLSQSSRLASPSAGEAASASWATASHSSIGDSRTWSWLGGIRSGRGKALEIDPQPAPSVNRFQASLQSSKVNRRRRLPKQANFPVIFTSDSENEQPAARIAVSSKQLPYLAQDSMFKVDLGSSNLAQSAGLLPLSQTSFTRRPKRRHRNSAAGRSSKRSNTSQSVVAIDQQNVYMFQSVNQRASFPSDQDSNPIVIRDGGLGQADLTRLHSESATLRAIRKLLRKMFDLEPQVLDTFLSDDFQTKLLPNSAWYRGSLHDGIVPSMPGFEFEHRHQGIVATVPVPVPVSANLVSMTESTLSERYDTSDLMLDGRDADDRIDTSSLLPSSIANRSLGEEEEEGERQVQESFAISPLLDNRRTVQGERCTLDGGKPTGLTQAALLRRRSHVGYRSDETPLMEPTTMEAVSALVSSVIPVPMPFRLLGVLARSFGWRNVWFSSKRSWTWSSSPEKPTELETDSEMLDEERRYRYDRLLSAQQARAWSRRYRGIESVLTEQETNMDVPECWRSNEHPAVANHGPLGEYAI